MPSAAAQLAQSLPVAEPSPSVPALNWHLAERLPCTVSIEVPVRGFTVTNFLTLGPGSVVSSQHPTSANLPLRINGQLVSWCEFEVLGNRLSVRLTEID
jgi:flagellar motor switch/type III secretory pathway protein FliN